MKNLALLCVLLLIQPLVLPARAQDLDKRSAQQNCDKALEAWQRGDFPTNLREMRKLAECGDVTFQNLLGTFYELGDPLPRDDAEAVKWYRKAAEQGHAQAQRDLENMYMDGRGVPQDKVKVATSLNNWALIHSAHGRYGRAESLYKRALAILENDLGLEQPTVAQILENYAVSLRGMGLIKEAVKLETRAKAIRAKRAEQSR